MIAAIAVDPGNADRLFVAVLGHPTDRTPNAACSARPTAAARFAKVLFKDDYTSANEVLIEPGNPQILYATLWSQQQSFIEGQGFGNAGMGIFKSVDGGATWTQLSEGLPAILQANIASRRATPTSSTRPSRRTRGRSASTNRPTAARTGSRRFAARAPRRGARRTCVRSPGSAAAISRRSTVDPKDPNVVYTASTVMWRTMDGGLTWSAVRGAPGGDDYQRIWVNPTDTNIILAVADQGAVVSANHGRSWSNWYNQNTAAMYHVTTDNAFPYRVCSGQQDSGSACVQSRSDDGRITFHDWHPVNIQEYGMAAPDPDQSRPRVWQPAHQRVALRPPHRADHAGRPRHLGHTARRRRDEPQRADDAAAVLAGRQPDDVLRLQRGVEEHRPRALVVADLAGSDAADVGGPRQYGQVRRTVKPAPLGSITALAPSPRAITTLWAGTDDGQIQVTRDGGATWANVTPPSIKPWTRIFNLEAGHFDPLVAYAAANTLRLDEIAPHFYRTHDGGKTWTEINTGITADAVANTIREDPRQPGLLYAGTDTQVWVSFDDGDHWQSLRHNMPAISVRDLQVKDDATCLCADLIAGTHGRGFWILDDVTPLRQAAAAKAALAKGEPYCSSR